LELVAEAFTGGTAAVNFGDRASDAVAKLAGTAAAHRPVPSHGFRTHKPCSAGL